MGRKRKVGGKPYGQKAQDLEPSAKLKLNSYEDIADSGDEFEAGKDQILLEEGPQAKRRRKLEEQNEYLQPSDEEVLGYDSEELESKQSDGDEEAEEVAARGRRQGSMDYDEEEQEEEDDYAGWGPKKGDYYNADIIETEQDALEEEQEANRLQQKQLQSMTEADFGFDEAAWLESTIEKNDDENVVVREVLPQVEITDDMPEEERLKVLKTRYPEFEPLAKDFIELQPVHEDLKLAAAAAEAVVRHVQSPKTTKASSEVSLLSRMPVAAMKLHALSAYLAALSMYFVLLTSTSTVPSETALALSPKELQDHPIMGSLVKCRKIWDQVRGMKIPDVVDLALEVGEAAEPDQDINNIVKVNGASPDHERMRKATKQKKTKLQRAVEAAQAENEAQKVEKLRKTEAELADLSSLLNTTGSQKREQLATKNGEDESSSDFGDETGLTVEEAAEKANRKKSLRFYTSQITQRANKRGVAGRNAGGDDDIPYRERLKDRQARLNAEAERRGNKKSKDVEDLGGDSDEEDRRVAKELRNENDNEEDYYDFVSARATQRKTQKAALARAISEAAAAGGRVETHEEIGPDGKRKISYIIEKNKGLTPNRKKAVRNPRVKKRKKFEEKKKKLASIRAVYKGGEGRGGYGGELTGIKKNMVKSVKL